MSGLEGRKDGLRPLPPPASSYLLLNDLKL
jgi:hypothetical protein